jgi:hypothetical protein
MAAGTSSGTGLSDSVRALVRPALRLAGSLNARRNRHPISRLSCMDAVFGLIALGRFLLIGILLSIDL